MNSKDEKKILKLYRLLYDSKATEKDFKGYEDLYTIMLGEGIIEKSYMGLGFSVMNKSKFFVFEDFENWLDTNYFIPKEEEKTGVPSETDINLNYNIKNEKVESLLKEFLGNEFKELIAVNKDPKNPNIYLTLVKQKNNTNNGITDTRFSKFQAYLVYLDVDDVREVNTGQSLVKYFSNILIDAGFNKFAIIDMDQTKNYKNWVKYKDDEWDYGKKETIDEGISVAPNQFNKIPGLYDYLIEKNILSYWTRQHFKILDYNKTKNNNYTILLYLGDEGKYRYATYTWYPQSEYLRDEGRYITDEQIFDRWTTMNPNKKYDNKFKEHFKDFFSEDELIDEEFIGVIQGLNGDFELYKNPKSLADFPHSVRAIITKEGDVYVPKSHLLIHSEILRELKNAGILEMNISDIIKWKTSPQKAGFITVQRPGTKNEFDIGGSIMNNATEQEKEWIDNVLKLAKQKNPYIEFNNKKINPEFDTIYNPEYVDENNKNMKNIIISLDDYLKENSSFDSIIITLDENNYNEETLNQMVDLKQRIFNLNKELNNMTIAGEDESERFYNVIRDKTNLQKELFYLSKKSKPKKEPIFVDENTENNNPMLERENQIKVGTIIEKEHEPTYNWIKKYLEDSEGIMPSLDEFAKHISIDHIDERDDYYIPLIEDGIADEKEAIELYNKIKKGE